jgi:predicted secreted hydrolase
MAKLNVKVLLVSASVLIGIGIGIMLLLSLSTESYPQNDSIFGRTVFNENTRPGEVADPNYKITWPDDHASHNSFDIEWWYLTANLEDEEGQAYGMQWTLFRFRNPSGENTNKNAMSKNPWANEHIFMAHASIHSMDSHWFAEKFARGGVGNAGVESTPFSAFIDDWEWRNTQGKSDLFPSNLLFTAKHTSKASEQNDRVQANFTLKQSGPLVLHGQDGYSVKSSGGEHASHYYSAPFIDMTGELRFGSSQNQTFKKVKGQAWYDHEWTSQLLDTQTLGWDWLSLHLDDGSKIMAFRMRLDGAPDYITGSFISANGEQLTLKDDMITLKPIEMTKVKQKTFPLDWSLNIPSKDIELQITTSKDDQYNTASVPYYEGMVSISGTHQGRGFLELTGY